MKRLLMLAPALIGALCLGACNEQRTTTETMTTSSGDSAVILNTETTAPMADPAAGTTTTTTTVYTDQSAMGTDSTAGQQLRADARNAGQDIKEGYKDARDATGEAAGKVGHDVKQGYKNTRDDIKAGVDAAKENKERR